MQGRPLLFAARTAKAVKGVISLEVGLLLICPCRTAGRCAARCAFCAGQAAGCGHRVAWPQRKAVEGVHLRKEGCQ